MSPEKRQFINPFRQRVVQAFLAAFQEAFRAHLLDYRSVEENMVVAVGMERIHYNIAALLDRIEGNVVLHLQLFRLEYIEFPECVFFGPAQDTRDGLWLRLRC